MNNLTAATVHYGTPKLLMTAIESIKAFYPNLRFTVINGSEGLDDWERVKVVNFGFNIGHGPGMHKAILDSESDYILLFDTDIVMNRPCLEQMVDLIEDDTFAVGRVYMDPQKTYGVKFGNGDDPIPIIHPSFHIVQKKEYKKYHPYIQNGGPCFLTALDIFSKRLSDKVLKDFPVNDYIDHSWRGTRDVNPPDIYKGSVVLEDNMKEQLTLNWANG